MALKEKTSNTKGKVQKFTEEEISKIKALSDHMNKLTISFGQLYLAKSKLEEQEANLKNHLKSVETEEKNLANSLNKKYGKGTLDIETGKFIPTE